MILEPRGIPIRRSLGFKPVDWRPDPIETGAVSSTLAQGRDRSPTRGLPDTERQEPQAR